MQAFTEPGDTDHGEPHESQAQLIPFLPWKAVGQPDSPQGGFTYCDRGNQGANVCAQWVTERDRGGREKKSVDG